MCVRCPLVRFRSQLFKVNISSYIMEMGVVGMLTRLVNRSNAAKRAARMRYLCVCVRVCVCVWVCVSPFLLAVV